MNAIDIVYGASLVIGLGYILVAFLLGEIGSLSHDSQGGVHDTAGHSDGLGNGHHADVGHSDALDSGHSSDVAHQSDVSHTSETAGNAEHAENQSEPHPIVKHVHVQDAPNSFGETLFLAILSFLSPLMLSAFLIGFGSAGLIALFGLGLPARWSIPIAFGGGFGFRFLIRYILTKLFAGADSTSHFTMDDLVGALGEVIVPIPKNGMGKICVSSTGSRQSLPARMEDTELELHDVLPNGIDVRVKRIENGIAYVIRND